MISHKSAHPSIWVLTIHDREPQGQLLSFDMKEILLCLAPAIHSYVWVITDLDCTGEEAQPLCDAVDQSRRGGKAVVLSWAELFATCQKFEQTLDATIIATPQKDYTPKMLELISDLSAFPNSEAELVIRAVDSSFFEVMTKHHDHVDSLRKCFEDVRAENPANYFAGSVKR